MGPRDDQDRAGHRGRCRRSGRRDGTPARRHRRDHLRGPSPRSRRRRGVPDAPDQRHQRAAGDRGGRRRRPGRVRHADDAVHQWYRQGSGCRVHRRSTARRPRRQAAPAVAALPGTPRRGVAQGCRHRVRQDRLRRVGRPAAAVGDQHQPHDRSHRQAARAAAGGRPVPRAHRGGAGGWNPVLRTGHRPSPARGRARSVGSQAARGAVAVPAAGSGGASSRA